VAQLVRELPERGQYRAVRREHVHERTAAPRCRGAEVQEVVAGLQVQGFRRRRAAVRRPAADVREALDDGIARQRLDGGALIIRENVAIQRHEADDPVRRVHALDRELLADGGQLAGCELFIQLASERDAETLPSRDAVLFGEDAAIEQGVRDLRNEPRDDFSGQIGQRDGTDDAAAWRGSGRQPERQLAERGEQRTRAGADDGILGCVRRARVRIEHPAG